MKLNITFPIIESYSSDNYALILVDSADVIHYFDFDGTYDGWSSDPHIDGDTGVNLN